MIAEDLNIEQITDILDHDMRFNWRYERPGSAAYAFPEVTTRGSGDLPFCILAIAPNESSTITIHSLTSDDDSNSRLVRDDALSIAVAYWTEKNSEERFIERHLFDIKPFDYPKYKFTTNTGDVTTFLINKSYKLSDHSRISYKDIRVFTITMKVKTGFKDGNELNMTVSYKHY